MKTNKQVIIIIVLVVILVGIIATFVIEEKSNKTSTLSENSSKTSTLSESNTEINIVSQSSNIKVEYSSDETTESYSNYSAKKPNVGEGISIVIDEKK